KARLILMLADVYHEAEQWQQSLDLCTRVIDNAARNATREQRSYAFFRRGRNFYCLEGEGYDPEAALADYVAAAKTAPKAPWADKATFLGANLLWNFKHDASGAIAMWRLLLKTYPDSDEADRSAYFIGVVYELTGRAHDAETAFTEFLATRSGSRLAGAVREHLKELERSGGKAQSR
ncbi:MAG: hypothetical protein U1E05_12360, partial [Patescibacteria group bacterium]|nr:hypothetical protein [Patescibacteria group bacterium]